MDILKLRLKRRPPMWFLKKKWDLVGNLELKAGFTTSIYKNAVDSLAGLNSIADGLKPTKSLNPDENGRYPVIHPEGNKYGANFPLQWFEEIK